MKLKLGQMESKAVLNEERWCSHHRAYLVNKPLQAAGMSADNVRG